MLEYHLQFICGFMQRYMQHVEYLTEQQHDIIYMFFNCYYFENSFPMINFDKFLSNTTRSIFDIYCREYTFLNNLYYLNFMAFYFDS